MPLGELLLRKSVVTLFFCFAATAAAAEPEYNFTGPLVTPNASALPGGMVLVEPYLIYTESHADYDNTGDRHDARPGSHQWLLLVPATVGITDRLNAQLTAGTAYNVSGKEHSDGTRLTDTSLMLQYMIVAPRADGTGPAVSLSATHVFPTGKYDKLGDNPLNGTGSGASSNRIALFAQQKFWLPNDHPLRVRALIAWGPSPSTVRIDGVSSHGTPPGFQGTAAMGTSMGVSAAVEYGIDRHWALAADLAWDHRNGTHLQGTVCPTPAACSNLDQRNGPNWTYSVSPAVEYNFNASVGLIVGAQLSFAGHNASSYWAPQAALNMVF